MLRRSFIFVRGTSAFYFKRLSSSVQIIWNIQFYLTNTLFVAEQRQTDRQDLSLFYLCTWCKYCRKTNERLSQTTSQMVSGMNSNLGSVKYKSHFLNSSFSHGAPIFIRRQVIRHEHVGENYKLNKIIIFLQQRQICVL